MHIAHCRLSTRYSTQPSLFISYSSTLDDRSDRPLLLVEFDMKVVSSSASSIPSCCSGRVLLLQMSCRRSPTRSNRSSPAPKFPFDRHPASATRTIQIGIQKEDHNNITYRAVSLIVSRLRPPCCKQVPKKKTDT